MAIEYPDPSLSFASQKPLVLLSCGVFGESRDQPFEAMLAVACVVKNRMTLNRHYMGGNTVAGVLLHPEQFDCFMPDDPNASKLLTPLKFEAQSIWELCYTAAYAVYSLGVQDTTRGAVFYFSPPVVKPRSSWGPVELTKAAGNMKFFRESATAAAKVA